MSLSVDGRHIVGAAQRVQPLLSLQLGRQVRHRLTVRVVIGRGHEVFRAFRALKAVGEAVREAIAGERAEMLVIAAATEADIAELEDFDERQMFLEDLGLEESGVARLIKSAYKLLNLETFFTTGADETRAWTYLRGMKAPQTAGIIHTDFEKGFIRAEVIKYDDYTALGSEKACRDAGKLSIEGKEYVVEDGDIMHFLFNV